MTELPSYLPIELETTTFDLIVVGTGIPESVIAAAASATGKTVLHLDPNQFYGSHSASIHLNDLTSFLNYHANLPSTTAANTTSASSSHDFTALNLSLRSLYSNVETANYAPETLAQHSTKFRVDLGGPRVFLCADKATDLLIKSGINAYLDFKGIEASFIWDGSGRLCDVPDSRSAIFKDKSLSLLEKNQLMRFFKLVQRHLGASNGDDEGRESSKISEEDLESPFVEFLKKMRLPPKIKSIILYAICMVDYDQDNLEVCKSVLKTRDGMERLALYQNSIGRYGASGALLYPTYGIGELSQAFCRRAAVKGCIYVLRMPVTALLMDQNSGQYKGVRLASGEDFFSHQLVLDPTFIVPLPPASSPPDLRESFQVLSLKDDKRKVARGICIINSSLKPDISQFLLIYPPRSLFPEQDTSIRALQIGGDLDQMAVCPSGMFVLYFSGLCDDAGQGKRLLHAAMNALLTLPVSESGSAAGSEDAEVKPTLLWSMLYIQELRRPPPNWQEIVAAHEEEKGVSSEPREEYQIPIVSTGYGVETQRSYKGRHCKKFYTEEGCPYGDNCTFLHDEQSKNRESVAISLGPGGYGGAANGANNKPSNWKTRICNKWELTGYCPFGSKCHFAHGVAELHRYGGGLVEGDARESSSAPPDNKQGGVPSKTPADTVVVSVPLVPHSDVYHLGVPSQRSSIVNQRPGQRAHQKWKGPDKISRIYGDWIDEIE